MIDCGSIRAQWELIRGQSGVNWEWIGGQLEIDLEARPRLNSARFGIGSGLIRYRFCAKINLFAICHSQHYRDVFKFFPKFWPSFERVLRFLGSSVSARTKKLDPTTKKFVQTTKNLFGRQKTVRTTRFLRRPSILFVVRTYFFVGRTIFFSLEQIFCRPDRFLCHSSKFFVV